MSIAEPIVTYEQGVLACWDRFSLLQWERLEPRVIARAKQRDPENVEVTEEDVKACLEEAVAEALKIFLQPNVST